MNAPLGMACVASMPDQICIHHWPRTTQLPCFQSGSFWFTWFCTRIRISLGFKIGINSFYNDLYRKEILFWYHVNKYRKMYRDENNELVLEWNWFLRDGELFEINQSSQGLINVTWCDLCPTELNCTNPFQQTP